jgi:hypothetical protein
MGHRLWEKVRCQHKLSAPSSLLAITHQSSWDFLRVGLPLRPAKSPYKTGVVLTTTFEEKLREGGQKTYHHGRQGIGTSRSALVVQRGRERLYPFTSKWLP